MRKLWKKIDDLVLIGIWQILQKVFPEGVFEFSRKKTAVSDFVHAKAGRTYFFDGDGCISVVC